MAWSVIGDLARIAQPQYLTHGAAVAATGLKTAKSWRIGRLTL
jgi:hypothetical protein